MPKMLMLATTAAMIEQFNKNNILLLKELGYEVHVAGNFEVGNPISEERLAQFKVWIRAQGGEYFNLPCTRKPFDLKNNFSAYRNLVNLIQKYQYKFIHCHTPIGAVIGRLAGHATKTKVMYTAHGFHFYKGAPLINWLMYYPVERFLAHYTDTLITINKEDYAHAQKFCAKHIIYIPGIGIDCARFADAREKYRKYRSRYGISENAFLIVSVGEVSKNKNHSVIIQALSKIKDNQIYYLICGQGPLLEKEQKLVKKLALTNRVQFVGFQKNVELFLGMGDIFAFPSKREGLGLAAIEAMAAGLPIITSDAGGIKEYSQNQITGYRLKATDVNGFAQAIINLNENKVLLDTMGKHNIQAAKRFDVQHIQKTMEQVYRAIIS